MSAESTRLLIERLGAQGDGIARTARGHAYVPFALPGETITAAVVGERGTMMALIERAPERVEPPCRHFGTCGGCVLQHLEPSAYHAWKRDKLVQALAGRGLDVAVDPLVTCAPESRRRAGFTARRTDRGIALGYNQAQSNDLVDIEECPILVPEIVAALPALREIAGIIAATGQPFRLLVTATATGLDIAAVDSGPLSEHARHAAGRYVLKAGFARLSVDGEIVIEPRKPVVKAGDVALEPQPGGFLQAVASAEDAMAALAVGHLGKSKKVADLFSGAGAFALRLARHAEVHAVEAEAAALGALDRAFRFAVGLKRITLERRDLFRRPLTFKELNAFGGVIFDPPRAGAEDQARQIARSDVPKVVAVSCNPVTFSRDVAILVEGGYILKRVVPIDQFLWSPHVEAVALLEKPKKRR
jgi:23S rRNA (uracil1939-C5)-methyltransferase